MTSSDDDDPVAVDDGGAGATSARSTVTVRYWAAARAAAGRAEDQVDAGSVADVLRAVGVLHAGNPRFAQVLGVSSLLLAGEPLGARDPSAVPVGPGTTVEVLPPFAGG